MAPGRMPKLLLGESFPESPDSVKKRHPPALSRWQVLERESGVQRRSDSTAAVEADASGADTDGPGVASSRLVPACP